jgi:hypothetical protein
VTTRQLFFRRIIRRGLTLFAFLVAIRVVDKFLLGEANTRLIDAIGTGATAVYFLSIYRTPCLSCGKHPGWRILLYSFPGGGITTSSARCPHCGTNINRDVPNPVI